MRRRLVFRVPSLTKRIAARTSIARLVRNQLGLRAPRGWGWLTNPRRTLYNRIYDRTSIGCGLVFVAIALPPLSWWAMQLMTRRGAT